MYTPGAYNDVGSVTRLTDREIEQSLPGFPDKEDTHAKNKKQPQK